MEKVYKYYEENYKLTRARTDALLEVHRGYNTLVELPQVAIGRFNANGDTADVLDCVSVDGTLKTIRLMCLIGRIRFPLVKYIRFERANKKKANTRRHLINKFIKGV